MGGYNDNDNNNSGPARDEFGRAIHGSNIGAVAQISANLHTQNTTEQKQHEERYYHGNQHPPSHHHNHNQQQDQHYGPGSSSTHMGGGEGNGGIQPGTVVRGQVVRTETYGAFVEFRLAESNQSYRGLVHISQMAPHRVEKVEDVVHMKQDVYAVILEVNGPPGREKFRLSLVGVDQDSGALTQPPDFSNSNNRGGRDGGGRGGGRNEYRDFRLLQDRAKQRREMFRNMVERHHIHWWGDGEDASSSKNDRQPPPSVLRLLWSPSPEPPKNAATPAGKSKDAPKPVSPSRADKKTKPQYSSDSSSDSSSGSDSEDSRDDRRRGSRDKRKRPSRSSRGGRSSRGRNDRSKGRRSRRRSSSSESSSSSSSGSSSSDSDSGSSSGSSSRSTSTDNSRAKKRSKDTHKEESPTDTGAVAAPPVEADTMDDNDLREAQDLKRAVQGRSGSDDEDDDDFGPAPLPNAPAGGAAAGGGAAGSEYGGALLPGEGQALAQYVQQNLRIPRRGEIGYQGDEIESFEKTGYVMSGSRHARMNAVRIRKENQVYSAEEQRALALITMEENASKEAQLMEDFRTMLKAKKAQKDKS